MQTVRLQISKWGNSLAVRLPASYTKQAGVTTGDYLEAKINASCEMHLVPSAPKADKALMLKKISALHKNLPQTKSVMDALRKDARY
jgi:antitoxin MazE